MTLRIDTRIEGISTVLYLAGNLTTETVPSLLELLQDIEGEIARRSDKSFSWYAYACASFAATRMQGKGVVKIECAEP